MGMFDSFHLEVKCPNCGRIDIVEFQTKQFECSLREWKEDDIFDPDCDIQIQNGLIKNVYGGCKVEDIPDCGREWEKKHRPNCHGFGRPIMCDVLIVCGIVNKAVNVRIREED